VTPKPLPPDGDTGAQRREELLAALQEVPPMAPVAMRILELTDDPDSSAADFARVISRDQGLAVKVLRTCNSAAYAPAQPVTSLPQAVVVLGQRTVRNLVFLHSLPVGKGKGGRMTEVERRLWTHSVGSALSARFVALEAGRIDHETAFLAGLFHDLGRLLLYQVRPLTYEKLCREHPAGRPDPELERAHLQLTHTEVGGEALRRWQLGEELADVARDHHEEPSRVSPLIRAVIAGEGIIAEPEERMEAGAEALRLLGVPEARVEALRERVQESIRREEAFFGLAA